MNLSITIYQLSPHLWLATIAGGWWLAYGPNKREAVRRVVRNYEKEMS